MPIPAEIISKILASSVDPDASNAFDAVASEVFEFVGDELRLLINGEYPEEEWCTRLRDLQLCISRMLLVQDQQPLNLFAAALSAYLDAVFVKRSLLRHIPESEIEAVCTMCFFYLKNSAEHIIDLILQAEFMKSEDWMIVKPFLQKLKLCKEVIHPNLDQYLKLLLLGRTVTVSFGKEGRLLVNSMLRSASAPNGVEELLKKEGIYCADLSTDVDFVRDFLTEGIITDEHAEKILDAIVSHGVGTGEDVETMETLEAAAKAVHPEGLFCIDTEPGIEIASDNHMRAADVRISDQQDEVTAGRNTISVTSPAVLTAVQASRFSDEMEESEISKEASVFVKIQSVPKKRQKATKKRTEKIDVPTTRSMKSQAEEQKSKDTSGKNPTKNEHLSMEDPPRDDPTPPLKMRLRHSRLNAEKTKAETKKTRTMPSTSRGTRSQGKARTRP